MMMVLPDTDTMYQALLKKDPAFEGIFIVGVKTTGIFCRPTCSARKPKKSNTEFFPDTKSAQSQGYRACKICRPLEKIGALPTWLLPLFHLLEERPEIKIRDQELKDNGLDPTRVRRWFQRNYDMTFQAYQRQLLVNRAHAGLKLGADVTQIAYDQGYESLSGFGHTVKKTLGVAPNQIEKVGVILTSRILTPLGPMIAACSSKGICLLEFADRPDLKKQINGLDTRLQARVLVGENDILSQTKIQLEQYFENKRTSFDIPLDPVGTDFQRRVWQSLMDIPHGTTRSYLTQARTVQNERSVRAVATANGANKIAIIIPCHRVIGSDGSPTGYAGGIWRKKWLLDHELVSSM